VGNSATETEVKVSGLPSTEPAVKSDKTSNFSVISVPPYQEAIWLAEIGIGAGITTAKYNPDEMLELAMIAKAHGAPMALDFVGKGATAKKTKVPNLPALSEELHSICKNSIECSLQGIRTMINEERAKFGGTTEVGVATIATYDNHAIVFNTNREVFRAAFSKVDGKAVIGLVEKLDMRPIKEYLEEEIQGLDQMVEDLLEGRSAKAKGRVSEVIAKFGNNADLLRAKYRVMARQMTGDHQWKKYMAENNDLVRKLLHGELSKLRETTHKPRYSALYTTEKPTIKVGMAEKLIAELKDLGSKAQELVSRIHESVKVSDKVLDDTKFHDLDSDVQMGKFKGFAADYVEDLQGLRTAVQEALTDGDVTAMALVYDTAAEKFESFKMAGRLIEKVLEDLKSKAHNK
jgi:ElaB/YqjD/DUF883 family membrane-anchored ribosome-binding protein